MQLHGHRKRGRSSTTFVDTLKRNLEAGSKFELESCMLRREDWRARRVDRLDRGRDDVDDDDDEDDGGADVDDDSCCGDDDGDGGDICYKFATLANMNKSNFSCSAMMVMMMMMVIDDSNNDDDDDGDDCSDDDDGGYDGGGGDDDDN